MLKIFSIITLAACLTVPVSSFAQKIGFVNVTVLFNEYAKAKGIDKMMEKKFSGPKKELEKLVEDIKTLEKEIKTNELLMTESKLTKSKEKLQAMFMQYRESGAKLEQQVKTLRNKEMSEFRAIVFSVTKKFATEKKYDLIVNEGIMFASDDIDITQEILAQVTKAAK